MDKRLNRPRISETRRYAIFGAIFGVIFPLVGTLTRAFLMRLPINISNMIYAQSSDPILWIVDTAPIVLGMFAAYAGYKQDQVSRINKELYQRESELVNKQAALEQYMNEHTSELELANQYNAHRAKQFESIAQVSRVINQTQGLQDLLLQIAQVISQQFNFYHVGIFLLDANNEYAVFSASNSEGGQKMLARNHKLKVGQEGIVGVVARSKAPRIALDIGADAIYFNNPDLPETRSEMALPLLQTGGQIIGVLDIQSTEANAFSREDLEILLTLANQVATAIGNARFYEQTQKALLESEMFYRSSIQTGWKKFARAQRLAGIRRHSLKSNLLLEYAELPGAAEVMRSGNVYLKKADKYDKFSQVTIPMKLRGEVVGILNVKGDKGRVWSSDELDIIAAIVERAALSIENARLLEESRAAAEKERTIGEFSTKIGSLNSLDSLLQTTIQELGNVLPNTDIAIQLSTEKPGRT
jgi:GAF domain-containing protein